jgi:UDP-N-acetylglucosamine transferase subunit ALG13
MAHFVFITWDGGGNVSVLLGIARALVERGSRATILGPVSIHRRIEELAIGYSPCGSPRPLDRSAALDHLLDEVIGSQTMAYELGQAAHELRADALVIDCNLFGALGVRTTLPVAVVVHTAMGLYLAPWQAAVDAANARRAAQGLVPLPPAAEIWSSRDRLLITSYPEFDLPPSPFPANAAYVGLVRSPIRSQAAKPAISHTENVPLVLISYSTHPLLNPPERVQTALDALAGLPVRVIATASGAFNSSGLTVPGNAEVFDYVPHDELMPAASLVIAHAGHGTVLEALSHAVPLVCVPGLGRDQPAIAARVQELGLGIGLADGATAEEIRRAVVRILDDPSYASRARQFREALGSLVGAHRAAMELENMLRRAKGP